MMASSHQSLLSTIQNNVSEDESLFRSERMTLTQVSITYTHILVVYHLYTYISGLSPIHIY